VPTINLGGVAVLNSNGWQMKKSLLAGVSLGALALAGGAQAADLAARPVYSKAPVAVPTWSWAGFYVGANVGVASARTNISNPNNTYLLANSSFNSNQSGVIGGLQAGYNWQFNNFVFGLEGDISAASLGRSTSPGPISGNPTDLFNGNMTTLGTVRGRVGWAFDRLLIYGTGGVAFANLGDQYFSPAFPFTATASSSATGWTAGGGVEFAVWGNWTAKAEYLHVEFPSRSATATFGVPYTFAFKDSADIGRVGINYKF
jgi:outer membrane immunogenic protein